MDDRIRYTFSFSIDRDPAGFAILALVLLVWTIAWWTIFAKSGTSGLFGLLMMIPVINVIVFFMFAWEAGQSERSFGT